MLQIYIFFFLQTYKICKICLKIRKIFYDGRFKQGC